MAKVVRWLGAYRRTADVYESAKAEITGLRRQIAAEPLWRGRSRILLEQDHVVLGLVLDPARSYFVRGWSRDAWTVLEESARLCPTIRKGGKNGRGPTFNRWDQFSRLWHKTPPDWHGETIFDMPVYTGIALRHDAPEKWVRRAEKLSRMTGLPVVRVAQVTGRAAKM